jgi:hypothetical protein
LKRKIFDLERDLRDAVNNNMSFQEQIRLLKERELNEPELLKQERMIKEARKDLRDSIIWTSDYEFPPVKFMSNIFK